MILRINKERKQQQQQREHISLITTIFSNLYTYLVIIYAIIHKCNGHGRLIEPPSRASAWRYGFQTPPNYNDHELFCGGFARQWNKNDGKCGECGDAWDTPQPRAHEYGGKWGQGVIVRKYNPDSEITLRVELTASHMGYFEFRVCPDINAKQDCLDKYVLKIISGSPSMAAPTDLDTRFYPRNGSRIYEIKAKLPSGLKCDHCVLQWRYIAGNNWGTCADGTGAVGCGPQEEFRACADISIGETGKTTIRPFRPTIKPTTTISSSTSSTATESSTESGTGEETTKTLFISLFILILTLLSVLCLLAAIYLYHYHGQRVKQFLRWKRANDPSALSSTDISTSVLNNNISSEIIQNQKTISSSLPVPVPPPRTKRLSTHVKEISPDESSVVIGQQNI